jgi:uncharacterized protein (DUF2147 family)
MRILGLFVSILCLTFSTLSLSTLSLSTHALSTHSSSTNDYSGFWWSEDHSSIFELVQTEQTIEGITRWAEEPRTDSQNSDVDLRQRSLLNVIFLWGFEYKAKDNIWQNGQVYDPGNGKTYRAKLELSDNGNILEVRGYIGISLFGRNAKFDRVKYEDMPAM